MGMDMGMDMGVDMGMGIDTDMGMDMDMGIKRASCNFYKRIEHDDEDDDCGDGEASRGRTTTRRHRIKQAQCLASQRLPPSASVRRCLGIQGSTTLAGGAPMGEVPNGIKLGSSQWDAREDAHLGKKAIPAR